MKYRLTNKKIKKDGITLYQIEVVKAFNNLSKGEKGGFIQSEENLSQTGNAWVYENAMVYGNAQVYDDAKVWGNAKIYGNAIVFGNAQVYGDAQVYDNAKIYGDAMVYGDTKVYGNARVLECQRILTGYVNKSLKDLGYSLIAQIGVAPSKKIILYKRVNKISKGKYKSVQDEKFIYEDGKIAKVKDYDKSNASCSKGIHLSTPLYWDYGDTLIQCEVNFKDIITVQEGKVRCKKCKVIGEIKW